MAVALLLNLAELGPRWSRLDIVVLGVTIFCIVAGGSIGDALGSSTIGWIAGIMIGMTGAGLIRSRFSRA
ncbi:hypothetical protein [Sphingomonas sp. JC676]|uniref:hypothetical protein n=1 Tax=Sphingomonas sp. JC676 TaxID=2768065 RepID=UPI001CA61C49|nr:hypothetical protein [Sphingomonas sp. JC676]